MRSQVIGNIQKALWQYKEVDFNQPGMQQVFVLEGEEVPKDYEFLSLKFQFLTINVIRHQSAILWECHFFYEHGEEIALNREEFYKIGMNDIQVLGHLQTDLAALYKLYQSSPQLKPDVIFTAQTNTTMFHFLQKISPNLVQDKIELPEMLTSVVKKKRSQSNMIDHGILFNRSEFLKLIEKANKSSGFIDLYKKLRNSHI